MCDEGSPAQAGCFCLPPSAAAGAEAGDVIVQADQDLDSFFPAAFHKQFTHDIYAFKSF